jgi:myosin-1
VKYFNNKIVCDLIESKKPAGLIAFLDEECLLGKGTDMTFLEKCESNLKSHPHFERVKEKGKPDDSFVVKHYAGDVKYCVSLHRDAMAGTFVRICVLMSLSACVVRLRRS